MEATEPDPGLTEEAAKRIALVNNERTKLTATWINGMAIAAVAVGAIAPSVAVTIGSAPAAAALGLASIWISIGFGLHLGGRFVLGRLL